MKQVEKVQMQFNQQAEQFASWEVTGNEVNLQQFFRFCQPRADDIVLDVACGTGNMVIHCAPSVASVDGVDIAERMIALARSQAAERKIGNARFSVGPVEDLPFANEGHSLVMSRAAFHHFADPRRVLEEMKRCCRTGGRLFVQDIIAYDDPYLDAYVEELELAIDTSHCRTLHKKEFTDLFADAGLSGIHGVEFHIRLDLLNYVGHAVQSDDMAREVERLIKRGQTDPKLSSAFEHHNGRLFLLRNVLFLGGRNENSGAPEEKARRPRIVRLKLNEPLGRRSQ